MIETKDFLSGLVGLVIFLFGLFPILNSFNIGPSWFGLPAQFLSAGIITWIVAVAALILVFAAIAEITNSNGIGWWSIIIGFILLAVGALQILGQFGIGPGLFGITPSVMIYNVIMIIEGLFLMIAMFAMEL